MGATVTLHATSLCLGYRCYYWYRRKEPQTFVAITGILESCSFACFSDLPITRSLEGGLSPASENVCRGSGNLLKTAIYKAYQREMSFLKFISALDDAGHVFQDQGGRRLDSSLQSREQNMIPPCQPTHLQVFQDKSHRPPALGWVPWKPVDPAWGCLWDPICLRI